MKSWFLELKFSKFLKCGKGFLTNWECQVIKCRIRKIDLEKQEKSLIVIMKCNREQSMET